MPKTRSNLFDLINQGVTIHTSSDIWLDLGLIPLGSKFMIGYADFTADGKNITFDLRSNILGESTGTIAKTILSGRATVRDGTIYSGDWYRNGRLSTCTVISTGIEHFWLRISSKTNNAADAYWWIYYTSI